MSQLAAQPCQETATEGLTAQGQPTTGDPRAIGHTPESLLLDETYSRAAKREMLRAWWSVPGLSRAMRARVETALRVVER